MGIKFNGVTVKAMFVGDKPVVKVCVGGEQVWPTYGIFNGGTVTEVDGWRYHAFTESSLLEVVDAGLADVLVVDGGAGGGFGGGGGGMVWEKFGVNIGFDQPVTVGAGGAGLQTSPEIVAPGPGGPSSLGDLLAGGASGIGGSVDQEGLLSADGGGGTTGGGGGYKAGTPAAGGAGSVGGDGGDGLASVSTAFGGGGGATGDGRAVDGDDPGRGGDGGVGAQSAITGETYGGGGGGGGQISGGVGGTGSGGNGASFSAPATPGAPNTGGGGGGGAGSFGGASGGSGVVVVRTRIPA